MLYSLTCISSAVAPIPAEEFRRILAVSRINNRHDAITGMLLHKDGNYMHVLEGVRRKVEDKRQRVSLDYRLCNFATLLGTAIIERQFPRHAMGFFDLDTLQGDEPPGYAPFAQLSLNDPIFRAAPDRSQQLIQSFRDFV